MTISYRVGGSLKQVKKHRIRIGGVLRTVARRSIMIDDDLHVFYVAMTVSISPSPVSATGGANPVVTGNVTASVDGGTAPYTYSWTRKSGSGLVGTFGGSTFQTVAFQANLSPGETAAAIFTCTVTDANGVPAEADVSVTIHRT